MSGYKGKFSFQIVPVPIQTKGKDINASYKSFLKFFGSIGKFISIFPENIQQ